MDPFVSIIIPVFEEAAAIHETLLNLKQLNTSIRFEIIVCDGHPQKTTLFRITDPKIQMIAGNPGRAIQMNAGAAMAKGKILLFLHADTFLETDALEKIVRAFARERIAAGAFQMSIRSRQSIYRLIEFGVRLRLCLTGIPYGDQAIFILRRYFEQIGGYPEIPIMEDVALMRKVRNDHGKIAILNSKALTSSRRWEKEGILFCTLRNYMLILLYSCGVSPAYLCRYYQPHEDGK